jgi:branched-chain amino acid transport system permease protein
MSSYAQHVIIMGVFYAYLATAWNLIGGFAGQHSLGHAMFVGVGGYTSTLLFIHTGITPWIGAFVGAAAAGILALAMGFLSFRYGLRGPYFLLITIAFAEIAKIIVANLKITGASSGLYVPLRGHAPELFQFGSRWPYFLIIAFLCATGLVLSQFVCRSWIGFSLVALRENEPAARACGVAAERLKVAAFVVSAVLCAFGGTSYAQYTLFIEPQSLFGIGLSLELVLFAIVGGIGTVYGPAVGALVLFTLAEATRNLVGLSQVGNLHLIVYAIILLLAVMFFPKGLAGAIERLRKRTAPAPARIPAPASLPHATCSVRRENGPILSVEGATKRFSGVTAVSGVHLELAGGECVGVIGPNGSGKSTLINVISGVYRPDAGRIRLRDREIGGLHPEQICRLGVGRTHQIAQPFGELTAKENVMVGAFIRTRRRAEASAIAEQLLARMELLHLADRSVRVLTGANRKKVEIARALATKPQLLLLDEALAGLNEQECDQMIRFLLSLRQEGLALIVVEHIMRVVMALCDRVIFLNFGHFVAQGSYDEILRHPEVIRAYLGKDDVPASAG